jgi:hypothetical protein
MKEEREELARLRKENRIFAEEHTLKMVMRATARASA